MSGARARDGERESEPRQGRRGESIGPRGAAVSGAEGDAGMASRGPRLAAGCRLPGTGTCSPGGRLWGCAWHPSLGKDQWAAEASGAGLYGGEP